jgi:methionyl-tRNA formyltransferase
MRNIILLCSGGLGEIALRYIHSTKQLTFVFTDKTSVSIIDYCKENGIALFIGNPRNEEAKIVIRSLKCNILLSINYLFVVGADLLSVAWDYAINVHGSLLPKYRGRTPHVWAIINGEKETGVTAHLMTQGVDDGKIVKQVSIPIEDIDTGFSVLQKFNVAYLSVIVEVLEDVDRNNVNLIEQDHLKATYFGKRTPDDGEIDWNWQKERIRNWVRAQRAPYPGAFSYYEGEKIIIHEIAYSEVGFNYTDKNGLILRDRPLPIIKTPNGGVTLVQFESKTPVNFESGKFLSCLKLE